MLTKKAGIIIEVVLVRFRSQRAALQGDVEALFTTLFLILFDVVLVVSFVLGRFLFLQTALLATAVSEAAVAAISCCRR